MSCKRREGQLRRSRIRDRARDVPPLSKALQEESNDAGQFRSLQFPPPLRLRSVLTHLLIIHGSGAAILTMGEQSIPAIAPTIECISESLRREAEEETRENGGGQLRSPLLCVFEGSDE